MGQVINPDYILWDNMWLMIFPLMVIGLVVGLKFEKIGGYFVTIPVGLGLFTFYYNSITASTILIITSIWHIKRIVSKICRQANKSQIYGNK